MHRSLTLSIGAVLLAAWACAAGPPGADSGTGAAAGREECGLAVLRNGFTIQFARSEAAGPVMRLWLCGDGEAGFIEILSEQIESIESPSAAIPSATKKPPDTAPGTSEIPGTPAKDFIRDLIAMAASRHRIDPDFVTSVVKAESGFNPTAVSPKGARGLMQLMPGTAARLGIANVLDPAANVEAGTKYLRQLLDQYDGDAARALAAYNAGPQRVEQYGGIPPYPETRAYISRIIEDFNRKKLREQAHPTKAPAAP